MPWRGGEVYWVQLMSAPTIFQHRPSSQYDSYWIDTACIPKDHQLRREAISQINEIFASSRLTLVCDLDLMAIDIYRQNFLRTGVCTDCLPRLRLESSSMDVVGGGSRGTKYPSTLQGRPNYLP